MLEPSLIPNKALLVAEPLKVPSLLVRRSSVTTKVSVKILPDNIEIEEED